MKHVPPLFNKSAFHCPHAECGAYANQNWFDLQWLHVQNNQTQALPVSGLRMAVCDHCREFSLWVNTKLIYPLTRTAPAPHPDLPEPLKADYEEARAVYEQSPRSSAALLRLVIQKLSMELGQPGKNLNADIAELVKQGLPVRVKQSLDIVRVVGNETVHPGVLDVRDNPEIALLLFELVDIIVENRIALPKQIDALYAKLPEGARKGIEDRDAKAPQ